MRQNPNKGLNPKTEYGVGKREEITVKRRPI